MTPQLWFWLGMIIVLGSICACKWLAEHRRARREWRKAQDAGDEWLRKDREWRKTLENGGLRAGKPTVTSATVAKAFGIKEGDKQPQGRGGNYDPLNPP